MMRLERWGSRLDKLNTIAGAISGILVLVMALIITYEVIVRRLFSAPTEWVIEISIYLCIGSVLLAAGYAMAKKGHIQVDMVTSHLSSRNQILFELVCLIASLIYCAVFTWQGALLALRALLMHEASPTTLGIPMIIPRGFMPIGGTLLVLEILRQILTGFSNLRSSTGDLTGKGWFSRNLPLLIFLALIAASVPMFYSSELTPYGLVLLMLTLMFGGMPIAFALGMLGLMGFYCTFGGGPMLSQVPMVTYKMLDDFVTTALPLFMTLSVILSVAGIGSRLFNFASTWTRHLPGGLGVATITACGIFAAMCGSSVATVATIGIIAIPEMLARNYDKKLVYGTVAVGGVLGPLIPPSIFMLLIGTMTGDSVGKLFMAGMLPGIMLAAIFAVYIILRVQFQQTLVKIEPASRKERWESFRNSFWGIMAPLIVLGGIYSGIFTPTEAAGVGVVYSLAIGAFVYRPFSWKKLSEIVFQGGLLTSVMLFMVTGALVFGQVVTLLKVPERVCDFLAALPLSPMTILWIALVFILVLGALMDEAGILLITYPTLYYVFVSHFGFDPIWFALVFVFTLEVGLIAPPIAINIFVVQGIWKEAKYEEIAKGILPFALLMVLAIFLVVYIKPLSTWLPRIVG